MIDNRDKKIGVFDSGLGGLMIAKALRETMPDYDYLYLGDTLHMPYGARSPEAIYSYSKAAMDYLFAQGCQIVVMACNTASALVLRRLQQDYLPANQSADKRILGVVIPMLEHAQDCGFKNIGVIGTEGLIKSRIYTQELQKISPVLQIKEKATPLLVPLIEHGGEKWLSNVVSDYIQDFLERPIEALILGCTHYTLLYDIFAEHLPAAQILSQDRIIPQKLKDYLNRHPEQDARVSRGGKIEYALTDVTDSFRKSASSLIGQQPDFQHAVLEF